MDECFKIIPDNIVWYCILPKLDINNHKFLLEKSIETKDHNFAYRIMDIISNNKNNHMHDLKPFILYAFKYYNLRQLYKFLASIEFTFINIDEYSDIILNRDDILEFFDSSHIQDVLIYHTIELNKVELFKKFIDKTQYIDLQLLLHALCKSNKIAKIILKEYIKKNSSIKYNLEDDLMYYSKKIDNSSIYDHELYDHPDDITYDFMYYLNCNNTKLKLIKKFNKLLNFDIYELVTDYKTIYSDYYEYWYNSEEFEYYYDD
jgi:hypothetical protein